MRMLLRYCHLVRGRCGFPGAIVLVAALMMALPDSAPAQAVVTVSNQFVKAWVSTGQRSGRFWITTGPYWGDSVRFLFATDPSFITSNIVFRVARSGGVTYYHNQPANYFTWTPTPAEPVAPQFKPYDSLYVSRDTLLMRWSGISGFKIILRFIAEKPATEFDTGGDMVMEFSYTTEYPGLDGELGILLMLDTFNSQATGDEGQGDNPSVLTSLGYLPEGAPNNSRRFDLPNMPEWYHVGNFTLSEPLNTIFPIHRLMGRSHGGKTLTSPSMFAVGNWRELRSVAWDLPSSFASSAFGDCATITRWEGLGGTGVVRTAFGTNDKDGNQNFTCRDENIFVDIRAPRIVSQTVQGGPYNPPYVDVEMWVTNLSQTSGVSPAIRLQSPLPSFPGMLNNRLLLDASTPATQSIYLPQKGTGKLTWRLNINPNSPDSVVQLLFYIKQNLAREHPFQEGCIPKINVRGWNPPPPPRDTLHPVITLVRSGRNGTAFWDFSIYDRHPGYRFDTGLRNPLTIVSASNVNFTVSPSNYVACDTTQTVGLNVTVIDTSRPASFSFKAVDCFGNDTLATIGYAPRPDTFPPEVIVVRRDGSAGPPCNARSYELLLLDETHQYPAAGDYGFGSVDVLVANNFRYTINNDQPIAAFATRVPVLASVIDTMRNGELTLRVLDYAGNQTILSYSYCTMPDILPPLVTVTPIGTGRWRVDASDERAWDRGLREVIELANPGNNMIMAVPPVITPGDRSVSFEVEAVDLFQPGDITLQVRDTIYITTPIDHSTDVRIVYEPGIPPPADTIAPNILFSPVPGSNGSTADVEVNDIHYLAGVLYPYDSGLKTVDVSYSTPNIRLKTPIAFTEADKTTRFQIEVIDTLVIGVMDTLCITSTDVAGNRSTSCYTYPIQPDTLAPLFLGSIDDARTALTLELQDNRVYDRGLGDVAIESAWNIAGAPTVVRGARAAVTFPVTDPQAAVSGELVLRDLVGTIELTPARQIEHSVRMPFSLSVVDAAIEVPKVVEGGTVMTMPIIARSGFGTDVMKLTIDLDYTSPGLTPTVAWRAGSLSMTSITSSRIHVEADLGRSVSAGDTLGVLRFTTVEARDVREVRLTVAGFVANDNQRRVITARRGGDTGTSVLSLPAPLARLTADSVGYINGTCERVLLTRAGAAKTRALEILALRPQPVVRSSGLGVEVDLRNLPPEGARAELVSLNGSVVSSIDLPGGDNPLERRAIAFTMVPQGAYILRIVGSSGVAQTPLVVVE